MAGVEAFLAALDPAARARFADTAALDAKLAAHRATALATFADIAVDEETFAAELARRLGPEATPEQLARLRVDHVHLAIACAAGDKTAILRFDNDIFDEIDVCARRMQASRDQADEVRGHLRRILFVSEPGRPAALAAYSGRGDLRTYLRVIATRELVRIIDKAKRELAVERESLLDKLTPALDPVRGHMRDTYRADVSAALRDALETLDDETRALLRYSVIDGWSVDRIGALYGVHRATAARRVSAARDALGEAIRAQLATRLAIAPTDVDSVVRLVQSVVDVSLERLLS